MNGPVTYAVSYADANFGGSALTAEKLSLNKTGTANGIASVTGSGANYTVSIASISGEGTLGISIAAETATDLAGNAATGATATTFIVDNIAPTLTISAPSTSFAKSGPVTYTVTYADANFNASTLTAAGVTLHRTETANGTVSVSGSGNTRTVALSSITGEGTLGISIAAGTASDRQAIWPRLRASARLPWTTPSPSNDQRAVRSFATGVRDLHRELR